jgi:cytidylate kinase
MTLVAISAAYGAGGGRIGPGVAQRLGVPFVDRAIPVSAAPALDVPVEEPDAAKGSWLERALRGFVGAEAGVSGAPVPTVSMVSEDLRRESEELLRRQLEIGDGVILGRAAVAVLRDEPGVLRVRLDGEPERRIEQAVRLGVERDTAAQAVRKLDLTHDAYLKEFYGADIRDPALYDLMMDSTVLPLEVCVEIIVTAARALSR